MDIQVHANHFSVFICYSAGCMGDYLLDSESLCTKYVENSNCRANLACVRIKGVSYLYAMLVLVVEYYLKKCILKY